MSSRPETPQALTAPLFYIAAVLVIAVKTMVATHFIGYELSFMMAFNTICLTVLYTTPCFWCGKVTALIWLTIANFVLTSGLIGDSLFHQYFNRIAPWASRQHIKELHGAASTVKVFFLLPYLLYVVDILVIIAVGVRVLKKEHFRKLSYTLRALVFVPVVLACLGWLHLEFNAFMKPSDKYRLEIERVTRFGTYAYHLFDIMRYKSIRTKIELTQRQVGQLRDVKEKQLAGFRKARDDYRGAAGGRNVIFILLESVQGFAVHYEVNGREVMPTLSRLAREGLYFENFYSQIGPGSTSDAEFLVQFSLYPLAEEHIFSTYSSAPLEGLPDMLKERGYHGYVFHGNTETFWARDVMYGKHGIERFFDDDDFSRDEIFNMGISDESFFRQIIDTWESKVKAPAYAFIITLTSHPPYFIPEEKKELDIPPDFAKPKFIDYLQSLRYLDSALKLFFDGLEEKGVLENSVVVLFGDHMTPHGYYGEELTGLVGLPPNPVEHFRVPLVIYVPPGAGGEKIAAKTFSIPAGQIDVSPTLLYLMGLEPERIFLGKNLITAGTNSVALSRFFQPEGSFVSSTHIFVNGYRDKRKCLELPELKPVDFKHCSKEFDRVEWLMGLSDLVIKGGIEF
ncbi:MAG: LTA synthase family protein [Pseudomonadota bacterium]